ncbi:isoprenoid synthase domain-containing protein [Schizophyllum commune]
MNELLVSHCYPYAGYEEFRTCCDFVNLLFVVDEVSDEQSGHDARETGNVYLRTMHGSTVDEGTTLYQMTKEFRDRLTARFGPRSFRRFLKHCDDYIEAVSVEAQLREEGRVLSHKDFIPLRRENSAIRLCFGLFEYCLGIDLPDYVFEDPAFQEIYWAGADLVCWHNDLYSYNMEQAKGLSGNNIVTVLMQERNLDIQSVADYLGDLTKELMAQYTRGRANLPSWGPEIDAAVARYADAVGFWIRGNIDWSFETSRYFGEEHLEVKRTRVVKLRPREPTSDEEDSDLESI